MCARHKDCITISQETDMFAFYSNRLGCLGSIVVSIVLSLLLILVMAIFSGGFSGR